MTLDIISLLQGGGNMAALACLFLIWKLDRRMVRLEALFGGRRKNDPKELIE